KQSGYFFWYENSVLQKTGNVSVDLNDVSLKEALDACFKNQPLSYSIIGKTVSVKLKTENITQEREIKGTVVDSVGAIPGVSVRLKAKSSVGTTTDAFGRYSIKIPN